MFQVKPSITQPTIWYNQSQSLSIDCKEDIYTLDHICQVVLDTNIVKRCESIISKIIDRPQKSSLDDYNQCFQLLFSLFLDKNGLQNSSTQVVQAFSSLPLRYSQGQQLNDKQQLTLKILLFLDCMLTNFSTLESDYVKSLVRDAFKLQLNSQKTMKGVIRFFNDLEDLARKIFSSPHLKPLRKSFYEDFCHFDEIASDQYDLFGSQVNNLVEMFIIRTKKIVGIDFKIKNTNLQECLNNFQWMFEFIAQDYPQKLLPYLLFQASKCADTNMQVIIISQIIKMNCVCDQINKQVTYMLDDTFIYYIAPKRCGNLHTMQRSCRFLLGLPLNINVKDRIKCCILSIAATMMLSFGINTQQLLQGTINNPQLQALRQVLNMIPYCNFNHIQEVIRQTAKAILTARKYQPRFLTFRFLTEQVQFKLKIAKIVALKERMFGKSEGLISASSSQTISDEQDLQFVLQLDNFSNQVNFRLNEEDQQFFLNIVEKTIFHLGISKQDAQEWKKILVEFYHSQLRCQPSFRPSRGQLDLYFHHIKLMLFSHYCQKTMKKYLNHQQIQRIFNQDTPDPEQIIRQLSNATPHYLGEWT